MRFQKVSYATTHLVGPGLGIPLLAVMAAALLTSSTAQQAQDVLPLAHYAVLILVVLRSTLTALQALFALMACSNVPQASVLSPR